MRRMILYVALLAFAPPASGQVIDWNAVAGNWNVPANWLQVNVPDAAGESAVIGNLDAVVTLNVSESLDAVLLSVPGARLNLPGQVLTTATGLSNFGLVVSNGGTNTINGPIANYSGAPDGLEVNAGSVLILNSPNITNNGRMEVNPTNTAITTTLRLDTNTALDGTGELMLTGTGTRATLSTLAGATLTQGAGHAIRGIGNFTASLANNGTVECNDFGGTMVLTTNAKTNNAVVKATNSGTLSLSSFTLTQGAFGLLLADTSGLVELASMTIFGGTLDTDNSGSMRITSGTNSLTDITNNGTLDALAGTATLIYGTGLNNNGVLRVNPANAGVATTLRFDSTGALGGPGELVLGGPGVRATLSTSAGLTITHDAAHTISGQGQITASLVNNGVVHCDVFGGTMALNSNAKTNNATMKATNSGTLALSSFTLTQGMFGLILADTSGQVELFSMTVLGGTLQTANSGLIRIVSGTNTLNSITSNAAIDATGGTATLITGTGFTNSSTLRINPANAGVATTLRFDATGNLGGPGELVLGGPGVRATLSTLAGVTLTHDAVHTIRGEGQITASLVNNGVIDSNVFGGTMTLNSSAKTNNALIKATNSGTLSLGSFTLTQGQFGLLLADAAQVELFSMTVVGGTLETAGGGLFSIISGTNTLNSITSNAALDALGGTATLVNGSGLTNNGVLRVNPANTGVVTTLRFDVTAPLSGTGELVLGGTTVRAQLSALAGVTVTQESGHTISGIGQIGAPLINQGTIAPGGGLSAGSLTIAGTTTQAAGSVLDFELAGTGLHDQIVGAGTINLGGTLTITLIDGHTPVGGETYSVITTTNRPGRFASFDLPALAPPLEWRVEYLPSAVRLKVGPFCFGDATFDNVVNFADITAVLANFNVDYFPAPGTGPGDSTRDGVVNFADVTNTLANFNVTCP